MFFRESGVEDVAQQMEQSADFLKENLDKLLSWAMDKAVSLLVTVIFLFVGFKLVKFILKLTKKFFVRHNMDASVAGFLLSLARVLMNTLVCITAATILGFEMTSFITLLGTASLAVGMALQGSLSNLAGGVLILLLKPFSVGDYIIEKGSGQEGTVKSIDIFYTRLITVDNRMVVVPNGSLSASSIINVTANPTRRLDLMIGVAYHSDVEAVKKCLRDAVNAESRVLQSEPIDVFIERFDASSIQMCVRFWVAGEDYWQVKWDMQQRIKETLDRNKIEIPFEQMDVYIKNNTSAREA